MVTRLIKKLMPVKTTPVSNFVTPIHRITPLYLIILANLPCKFNLYFYSVIGMLIANYKIVRIDVNTINAII